VVLLAKVCHTLTAEIRVASICPAYQTLTCIPLGQLLPCPNGYVTDSTSSCGCVTIFGRRICTSTQVVCRKDNCCSGWTGSGCTTGRTLCRETLDCHGLKCHSSCFCWRVLMSHQLGSCCVSNLCYRLRPRHVLKSRTGETYIIHISHSPLAQAFFRHIVCLVAVYVVQLQQWLSRIVVQRVRHWSWL
jgi:hypothetical protein